MVDYETFELGDVTLQSGKMLRGAKMAYKTYGTLNAAKDNVIVYPCWYSGTHLENEWLIGPTMALDQENISSSFRICSAMASRPRPAIRRPLQWLALPEHHRL